jgi:hypothetical protein
MRNQEFLYEVMEFLSSMDYVILIEELQNDPTRLKIKVNLKNDYILEIRNNQQSSTLSFCLLKNQERLWGLDYDFIRDWHIHPIDNPNKHIKISPKTIKEILNILNLVVREVI